MKLSRSPISSAQVEVALETSKSYQILKFEPCVNNNEPSFQNDFQSSQRLNLEADSNLRESEPKEA